MSTTTDYHITAQPAPDCLSDLDGMPAWLYHKGHELAGLMARPRVAVVGSRRPTAYGRSVTARLAGELAEQGVVIVSGLALGIDAIAHQAALDAGGLTMAVLPGGLDRIYPASHHQLAARIIQQGGCLLSEQAPGTTVYRQHFLTRNRLVSGLSQAVVIPEAAARSGSLNTAGRAADQHRTVYAVPGNIDSPLSAGTNQLIKRFAVAVTETDDILLGLGLPLRAQRSVSRPKSGDPAQQRLIELLQAGTSEGDALLHASGLDVPTYNHSLTMLELSGIVRPLGANRWSLA